MRYLSLDVALRHTGWALWEEECLSDFGCIGIVECGCCDVSTGYALNASELTVSVRDLLMDVSGVNMEFPTGSLSSKACTTMYLAIGVVIGVIDSRNIPITGVYPREAKKRVLHDSMADKDDVMNWARAKYPHAAFPKFKKDFEHIADAILIRHAVLIGGKKSEFKLQRSI